MCKSEFRHTVEYAIPLHEHYSNITKIVILMYVVMTRYRYHLIPIQLAVIDVENMWGTRCGLNAKYASSGYMTIALTNEILHCDKHCQNFFKLCYL